MLYLASKIINYIEYKKFCPPSEKNSGFSPNRELEFYRIKFFPNPIGACFVPDLMFLFKFNDCIFKFF